MIYTFSMGMLKTTSRSFKTVTRFTDRILNFSEKWNLSNRIVVKNGRIIDPSNRIDGHMDISILHGRIESVEKSIAPEKGDALIDASDFLVLPGLIDIHLHLHDLFEVSTDPIIEAATNGVTSAISPGAGNTLPASALLAAEADRGLPINVGTLVGAAAVLASKATVAQKIRYFKGEMNEEEANTAISRDAVTNRMGSLTIGVKDHAGHYLLSDDDIDDLFELTSKANLFFMSHTQFPDHTERVVDLSRARPIHLGHVTLAGSELKSDPVDSIERVLELIKANENVSGEFITSNLRPSRGNRDGVVINPEVREVALEALRKRHVKILISDGQADGALKGGGDTRDNIPTILELAENRILPLSDAVALMTSNPAELLSQRTSEEWWKKEIGSLHPGSRADLIMVNPIEKEVCATFVNGRLVSFEGRLIRNGYGAGGFLTRRGITHNTGIGYSNIFEYEV